MDINIHRLQASYLIVHIATPECTLSPMDKGLENLDFQIIYCPGVKNTSADVLSGYGQSIEGGNAVVAQNSLRAM